VFSAPPPGRRRKLQQDLAAPPLFSVNNGTGLSMSNAVFSGYNGRTLFYIAGTNSRYFLGNVTISDNVGGTTADAPVVVMAAGSVTLSSCTFRNNIFSKANAVYGLSANRIDAMRSTFINNNRLDGPNGE
jgi:hypothetical protein